MFIAVLPAATGPGKPFQSEVSLLPSIEDRQLSTSQDMEHRHGDSRAVDAATRLGYRNSLDPMAAGLIV